MNQHIQYIQQNGAPPAKAPDGVKTLVFLDKDTSIEWYFEEKDFENDKILDEFRSFVFKSFNLDAEANKDIIIVQIETESDVNNEDAGVDVETTDEFTMCYDEEEDIKCVMFKLKGDIKASLSYKVSVDLSEADVKDELEVSLAVPSTDNEWINIYIELQGKIGEALKNKEWEQDFSLADADEIEIDELENFKVALDELDPENGNDAIKLSLKVLSKYIYYFICLQVPLASVVCECCLPLLFASFFGLCV